MSKKEEIILAVQDAKFFEFRELQTIESKIIRMWMRSYSAKYLHSHTVPLISRVSQIILVCWRRIVSSLQMRISRIRTIELEKIFFNWSDATISNRRYDGLYIE